MTAAKYIRCSTTEQNTARQEVNSSKFDYVFIDKCSGTIKLTERKEGKKLIAAIESGLVDEVHINSICRLGRNLIDCLVTLEYLDEKKISLFVENIGMYSMIAGKPNPTFKMIVTILSHISALEIQFLRERQKSGIEAAKLRGTYTGRLYGTKMTQEMFLTKYKKVVRELKNGESIRRAAAIGECSIGTAQKIQSLIKEAA